MPLSIRVQFLAGYSGREWPPSPARLFKSLVSAARAGWNLPNRQQFDEALQSLEIECQEHPPVIAAPEATRRIPPHRRFVPNNSKNWPTERKLNPVKGIDLEPEPLLGWDITAPAVVWYSWPAADSALAVRIREIARRVPSLGRGEDFAIIDAVAGCLPEGLATWSAIDDGVSALSREGPALEVPEAGCLDVCDAKFWRSTDTSALPVTGVRPVRYAREKPTETASPTHVFALWAGGRRRSWDARLLRQVVGPIRRLLDEVRGEIVDVLASSHSDRSRLGGLAQRFLLGHDEHGAPVQEPHLAVLPIPSVLGPYPDGRIRRVALVGFGCAADAERRAIFDVANILLHGRELVDSGVRTGVILKLESDRQWLKQITCRSRDWVSISPIVQVARELTSTEWRRLQAARKSAPETAEELTRLEDRLQRRRLELVMRSLQQAVSSADARPANIEITPGGSIAGVHLATHYRVAGYLADTPRFHIRVQFDRAVAGPIAVGRGRHVGLGLLWPDNSSGLVPARKSTKKDDGHE